MNQLAVFTDWNDAITAAVHALGGFEKVGVRLRPELTQKRTAAAQWLRDCLNPEKRERLNPDQLFMLLRLAREADFHASKHWMDAELGYEPSKPNDPADEAERLTRVICDATQVLKTSIDRLERISKAPLRAINGGVPTQ